MNASASMLHLASIFCESPIFSANQMVGAKLCSLSFSFPPFAYNPAKFSAELSSFSHILSPVLSLEESCRSHSSVFAQIIPNSTDFCFISCKFDSVSPRTQQGSCINVSDGESTVFTNCLFANCTSYGSPSAGCIFSNGEVTVFHCCFTQCYMATTTTELLTNVIFCWGTGLNVSQSFFFLCGPSNSIAGDSTMASIASKVAMTDLNYTKCEGTQGGASISAHQSPAGSFARYVAVMQSGQWCSIEFSVTYAFEASYFNVINNTDIIGCYVNNYMSVSILNYFVFALNGPKNEYISVTSPSTMSVSNCISDISFTSATYNALPSMVNVPLISNEGCQGWLTNSFTAVFNPIRIRSILYIFAIAELL